MRKIFFLLIAATAFTACQSGGDTRALIETNKGDIEVILFESTPKHHDNFVKLAEEGYYEGTLFHRVMKDFMIQGGDPDSKGAPAGKMLGMGGPGYLIDQEIGLPHLRGALAAARTGNPEKASSGSQFYIVTGMPQSASTLDLYETQKGIKYSPEQRQAYTTGGGRPDLDMEYTVFGQVVKGMDVVDAISNTPTAPGDRPLEDVVIERVTIL